MYGLHMLMVMVLQRNVYEENDRWKRALVMIYASVRPESKAQVDEELKEMNDSVYMDVGFLIAGMLLTNTLTLGIGWAIHTFLA